MKIFDNDYIQSGDEIDIETGFLVLEDFNGSVVTCREYSYDDYGFYFVGIRRLTLFDIASLLKDADGLDHKVIWYEERYKI